MRGVFNRFRFFSFLAAIIIFLALAFLSFAGQLNVVRVDDGDTITVFENGQKVTIRLVGIDAPEISGIKHVPGQPFSLSAKEYLTSLVLNKVIRVKFYGEDGSGKSLGEIFAEGLNINIEMLKAGLAEVYRGTPPRNLEINTYREAEKEAKKAVKGIWVLRDQYFSPRDWREVYHK